MKWWFPGEGGGGNEELLFNECGVPIWEDKALEMDGVRVMHIVSVLNATEFYTYMVTMVNFMFILPQ